MATYYISTTGNDSTGAGTLASPWATLNKANASSTTGDTITMAAGTYTGSLNINQAIGQRFVIGTATSGVGMPTAIIDGGGSSTAAVGSIVHGTLTSFQYVMFQNFICPAVNAVSLIAPATSSTISFTNCVFQNLQLLSGGSRGAIFGSSGGTTTINLTSCLFYNCSSDATSNNGGYFGGGDNPVGNVNVINCTFFCNNTNALCFYARLNSGSGNLFIKNSIIYTLTSVPFIGSLAGYTLTYTGSVSNAIYGYTSIPTGAAATVTTDPLFVDPTNANFYLRPTSPCIDTGTI